jgi:hypothetical protein
MAALLPESTIRHYKYTPHKHVLYIDEVSRGPALVYYKMRCARCHDAWMYSGRVR